MTLFETRRMRFRRFASQDATGFFELNSDPEVIRYTGDPPFKSVEDAGNFISNYSHYDLYGYGRWAMELKESGEFIGFAGLKYTPELKETDLGFRLFKRLWGKGLATEAAFACLEYAWQQLELDTIVGRAMENNPASWRVLEKIGMQQDKSMEQDDNKWRIYFINKP